MTEFRIIRRAYSEYTVVETINGTWLEAMARAEKLQNEKRDGEYSVRFPGAPVRSQASSSYQSDFDWL